MELFDLSGKVALVTGTSRGLGQYFARALARAGADIAMTSRDRKTLAPFQAEIESLGRRTFATELDVRDHASIQQAVSPIDFDYWSWGMEKYERAVAEFDGRGLETWLDEVAGE